MKATDFERHPHSSPQVPTAPISNPARPYSPPSTLDRTPVLEPTPPRDDPPSRPPKPSPYMPNGERQVTAPVDPNKTIFQMHDEFTQAMEALKVDKNT